MKIPQIKYLFLIFISMSFSLSLAAPKNFIIILTDDQGYEDLSCFGSERLKTPNIDKLAKEGMRLTSFYVASSVCSPSRAALLTGRMPKRAGVPNVLFPFSNTGLPQSEITIAEMLKKKGYATGIVGKWHLGHHPQFMPMKQGFDSYFGVPYSNDMSIAEELPLSPDIQLFDGQTLEQLRSDAAAIRIEQAQHGGNSRTVYRSLKNKVPLIRGDSVVEYPVDQSQLTRRYTEEAVKFISTNKDKPFFLYVPHTMPHTPLFVSDRFKGSSGNSLYADIIQEIDFSVGQIAKAVKKHGLADETFILFCSDNGPAGTPKTNPPRGLAGPLRGKKFDTFEGGQRVPSVVWAPGEIPAGRVSNQIASTLDLFPTIAQYVGASLPDDRIYDGYNLTKFLSGKTNKSPRNEMYFYSANSTDLDGIRVGDWKYLNKGTRQNSSIGKKPMLFNLKKDIGESKNLIDAYPEKAEELIQRMKAFDETINFRLKR